MTFENRESFEKAVKGEFRLMNGTLLKVEEKKEKRVFAGGLQQQQRAPYQQSERRSGGGKSSSGPQRPKSAKPVESPNAGDSTIAT